nr:aldehyde dehydrogenase family protein [Micromonospora tarapacensis]
MTTDTHTPTGHWINGEVVPAGSADTTSVVNPATGEIVAEVPAGTTADVDRAVAAARAAFPGWAATRPPSGPPCCGASARACGPGARRSPPRSPPRWAPP